MPATDMPTLVGPLNCLVYVDTIIAYTTKALPSDLPYSETFQRKPLKRDGIVRAHLLKLQQPSPEQLNLVLGMHLSSAHLAYDFMGPDTNTITTYIRQNLIQKWRRRGQVTVSVDETIYLKADKLARRNIALYSDRLSKPSDQPCCHLELRFRKAAAVQAAGITWDKLINGFSSNELIKMLDHQTKIQPIDRLKLTKAVGKITSKTRLLHNYGLNNLGKRIESLIARAGGGTNLDTITSQQLADSSRLLRLCFLKQVPWATLIQSIGWHEWNT